jgi:hypothetical protein
MFDFLYLLRAVHVNRFFGKSGPIAERVDFVLYFFEVVPENVDLIAVIVELSMEQVKHEFLHLLHLLCQVVQLFVDLLDIVRSIDGVRLKC